MCYNYISVFVVVGVRVKIIGHNGRNELRKHAFLLLGFVMLAGMSAYGDIGIVERGPDQNTYVVKSGDTLSEICFRHLNDGTKPSYEAIARLNSITDPNKITPGQKIYFCNGRPVEKSRIAWQSNVTNFSSHGDWMEGSYETLVIQCKDLNRQYPELRYWIETE